MTAVDDDEPVENNSAASDESTAIELDEWKISKVLNLKKIKEKIEDYMLNLKDNRSMFEFNQLN